MARVTYGGGVTEFAGSIGGVTFQRNASGPIAKLRSLPPVNPSPDQSTYQTNMAILVTYWPTLSQVNKDLWDAFAAAHDKTTPWGETKTLSGFQWFLSINLYRLSLNQAILSVPPVWEVLSPPDSFTLVATSTYIRCEWSPDFDPLNSLLFYVSLPLRQSSLKLRRSLFYLHYLYTSGAISNYNFTALFESFVNVTWSTFYASANCSIIFRILSIKFPHCVPSAFTSGIVKIG